MNVKQLKDFRKRLKHAKKLCAFYKFSHIVLLPFISAGLRNQCADMAYVYTMPNDVYTWYVDSIRTPAERKAMWDNSIAAVDARIAKTK